MTVPQTAPKVCHPERRAKPGVEGSSHQFDCEDPVHAKILRLASLAQDDKLRTIGYLSGRLPRRFAPRNDVEISGRSFRVKNPPVPRNRGIFAFRGEEITSSGTPQQQRPRKRSCRPWGCCQCGNYWKSPRNCAGRTE